MSVRNFVFPEKHKNTKEEMDSSDAEMMKIPSSSSGGTVQKTKSRRVLEEQLSVAEATPKEDELRQALAGARQELAIYRAQHSLVSVETTSLDLALSSLPTDRADLRGLVGAMQIAQDTRLTEEVQVQELYAAQARYLSEHKESLAREAAEAERVHREREQLLQAREAQLMMKENQLMYLAGVQQQGFASLGRDHTELVQRKRHLEDEMQIAASQDERHRLRAQHLHTEEQIVQGYQAHLRVVHHRGAEELAQEMVQNSTKELRTQLASEELARAEYQLQEKRSLVLEQEQVLQVTHDRVTREHSAKEDELKRRMEEQFASEQARIRDTAVVQPSTEMMQLTEAFQNALALQSSEIHASMASMQYQIAWLAERQSSQQEEVRREEPATPMPTPYDESAVGSGRLRSEHVLPTMRQPIFTPAESRADDASPRPESPAQSGLIPDVAAASLGVTIQKKEQDKLSIPAFPTVLQLSNWRRRVRNEVATASARPHLALPWVMQTEDLAISDEQLQINPQQEWSSLDAKLSVALQQIMKGELGRRVSLREEELNQKGLMMSGRQKLRLIYLEFAKDKKKATHAALQNLQGLRCSGDLRGVETYLNSWDHIVDMIPAHARDPEVLFATFIAQIKWNKSLSSVIERFQELEDTDVLYTMDELRRRIDRSLALDRMERQNKEESQGLLNHRAQHTFPAASSGRSQSRPPNKGKGKSKKGKSSSSSTGEMGNAFPGTSNTSNLPCFRFQQGNCTAGDKCKFSHRQSAITYLGGSGGKGKGKSKSKSQSSNRNPSVSRSKGPGKGTDLKSKPCYFHKQPGGCKRGNECPYSHSAQAMVADEIEFAMAAVPKDDACFAYPREWILDSGSCNNLVSKTVVHEEEIPTKSAAKARLLNTANGVIETSTVAKVKTIGGEDVNCLVLEECPSVLSMGQLMARGYSFEWPAGQNPILTAPNGRKETLEVRNNVPMLSMPVLEEGEEDDNNEEATQTIHAQDQAVDVPEGPLGIGDIVSDSHNHARAKQKAKNYPETADDETGLTDLTTDERLRQEATSARHMLSHIPKNKFCDICAAKERRRRAPRRAAQPEEAYQSFGQVVTADHLVIGERSEGFRGERSAMVVKDLFSGYVDAFPQKHRHAEGCVTAWIEYIGEEKCQRFHSDCSKELRSMAKSMRLNHTTSTPYRPQGNSLIERENQVLVQGTKTLLQQSGLPHKFWPLAIRYFCFVRNATHPVRSTGKTPFELRIGTAPEAILWPFGARVLYRAHPHEGKLKFEPNSMEGLIVGYDVQAGGKTSGDTLVVAISQFESGADIQVDRVKEVVIPEGKPYFPLKNALAHTQNTKIAQTTFNLSPDEVKVCNNKEAAVENVFEVQTQHEAANRAEPMVQDSEAKPDDEAKEESGIDVLRIGGETSSTDAIEKSTGTTKSTARVRFDVPDDEEVKPRTAKQIADRELKRRFSQRPNKGSSRPHSIPPELWRTMSRAKRDAEIHYQAYREAKEAGKGDEFLDKQYQAAFVLCPSGAVRRPLWILLLLHALRNGRPPTPCLNIELSEVPEKADNASMVFVDLVRLRKRSVELKGDILNALYDILKSLARHEKEWVIAFEEGDLGPNFEKDVKLKHAKIVAKTQEHRVVVLSSLGLSETLREVFATRAAEGRRLDVDSSIKEALLALGHIGDTGDPSYTAYADRYGPWENNESTETLLVRTDEGGRANEDEHHTGSHTGEITDEALNALASEYLEDMRVDELDPNEESQFVGSQRTNKEIVPSAGMDVGFAQADLRECAPHRDLLRQTLLPNWCLVTRNITPNESEFYCPQAKEALFSELSRLRQAKVWDEGQVEEWSTLVARAESEKTQVVMGRLFPIIGLKHSEDARIAKYKARVVFDGRLSQMKTGSGISPVDLFTEISSTPASMQSARLVMGLGCARGHELTTRDAEQAYVQASIDGHNRPATWVVLPRPWRPQAWGHMEKPCCRLLKSLYGHPEAGMLWHKHLSVRLRALQWQPVEELPSVYQHGPTGSTLCVYVDDLVLSSPKSETQKLWLDVEAVVRFGEDVDKVGRFLGTNHHWKETTCAKTNEKIVTLTTEMQEFFLDAVSRYEKEKKTELRPSGTPHFTGETTDDLLGKEGHEKATAASHLMKILYGARMTRPDLCYRVCQQASRVTKWTTYDDAHLRRLMQYLKGSAGLALSGSMSEKDAERLELHLYTDADLAGDKLQTKSHSGYWLELVAADRRWPLAWSTRRQTVVAMSSAESETIAMAGALRREALPFLTAIEKILKRRVTCKVFLDNTQAIAAIKNGYSPALRHLSRTQRVSLQAIHEIFYDGNVPRPYMVVEYIKTTEQKADLMTKPLPRISHDAALQMLRLRAAPEFCKKDISPAADEQ